MLAVAWYRFRATFVRRRGSYLAIVLLVGLIGGVAMGAVAAARRTQSSFPAFLRATHSSQLSVETFNANTGASSTGIDGPPNLAVLRALGRLAHVRHAESEGLDLAGPVHPNGTLYSAVANGSVMTIGSIDGLGFDQDRITITHGRMANPRRADELVMSSDAARLLGVRVGDVVPIGAFTFKQFTSGKANQPGFQPARRINATLVGTGKFNNAIVQDDINRVPTYLLYTPALGRTLTQCCSYGTITDLQVDDPKHETPTVETEIEQTIPNGSSFFIHETAVDQIKAERAIKPESIALGVFGAIAALAALLIAGQAIGRHLRRDEDDLQVLRALGARPAMTTADGLVGTLGAVIVGALLAIAVAVGLSPLSPIGPVRSVYPSRGIAFDWTVLAAGAAILILVAGAMALALAFRQTPHRAARRARFVAHRPSITAAAAAGSGLPASATAGIGLALDSRRTSNPVPMRSAILGTALAVIAVIGTVTFGASLSTLVSHPALYGWNWDYMLTQGQGGGNISGAPAAKLLAHDPYVASSVGYALDALRIDGRTVPIIGGVPHAPLGPPLLSGHAFDATNEVVLGPSTLSELRKHLGDTVEASYGNAKPTALTIVGTATMPAVGAQQGANLSMGTGALVSYQLIPATTRNAQGTQFDPSAIFVRFRSGTSTKSALRSIQRIAKTLGTGPDSLGEVTVLPVQRPAEISNYRSMGSTPALLGVALALGAIVALGLTLVASVRGRRRDLALLKTIGFTRRQLAATVAWQSSVAVAIGVIVGVPLGIVAGRGLWDLFADQLHVVPEPSVPALTIALIALGALVLANLVAAIPGRQAARTQIAVLLREE